MALANTWLATFSISYSPTLFLPQQQTEISKPQCPCTTSPDAYRIIPWTTARTQPPTASVASSAVFPIPRKQGDSTSLCSRSGNLFASKHSFHGHEERLRYSAHKRVGFNSVVLWFRCTGVPTRSLCAMEGMIRNAVTRKFCDEGLSAVSDDFWSVEVHAEKTKVIRALRLATSEEDTSDVRILPGAGSTS